MGKANNLKQRVSSYFTNKDLGKKTSLLVSKINKIKTIETYSEVNSLILEANLIKKHLPEYNIKLTDDKFYQYVKITIKDKYPKVLICRKIADDGSLYFGPYPSAKSLRLVLKTIRKIFPFQSVLNHSKKRCLLNHIGLCPCPEALKVSKYKSKNIKYIIRFLKGENKKTLKDLVKEREIFVKKEKFEKASEVQQEINAIKLITNPENRIFDFNTDANLALDIKTQELEELKNILNINGYKISILNRIECFDISNMSGENIVGSMVVFKNGFEQKSEYRRFKIRSVKGRKQDDYKSINEMLTRRLKRKDWKLPDLIIIDGGKGQVTSTIKSLSMLNLHIPVIGLAKSKEKIITSFFKEILLKYDSKALLLIRRVRDEAHRFAISYHKKLRAKSILD